MIKTLDEFNRLRDDLVRLAEERFGPRDISFSIRDVAFVGTGPRIRVSGDACWAYPELSLNAKGYWPTAIFEMAHEAVHLLDPVEGHTNYLEEGVAVLFQLELTPRLANKNISVSNKAYRRAAGLVRKLGGVPLVTAASIRIEFGAFSKVTFEQLRGAFPKAEDELLKQLVTKCIPR